jgi:N-methylhydantoinase A/oxoprolinase/acetone carboxylase beta subunit
MPINEEQIRAECKVIRKKNITDVAIIGVFSPLDTTSQQELKVKAIVAEEIPEADIVCSRDSQ